MDKDSITFSFGANWRSFVDTVSEASIQGARADIQHWLGSDFVRGKTVLDIGCGSGIHSLVFHLEGAKEIVSLDADPLSVEATNVLHNKAGQPAHWKVMHGSVLDRPFVERLGTFDLVYSWGVLHHTGAMWEAINNSCLPVKRGGLYWIAIYVKGPNYERDLALKRRYNQASRFGKKIMVARWVARLMRDRFRCRHNPLKWNQKNARGMDTHHDIIDWLGGLPYEVASDQEIIAFCQQRGLALSKVEVYPEGWNNLYLFSRPL